MVIDSPQSSNWNSQPAGAEDIELAQVAGGESIGQVTSFQGTVSITRTDGTRVPATDGTPIFQGDSIETAAGGAVGITFADDSTFALADSGSMVIDEMVYDPGTQKGSSAFSVAEGVFTFVSGQIAKTDVDAMIIKTPVATIGVRGTEGGGKAGPEGTNNTFSLFNGEMTVTTLGGSQTLNAPNQTTSIASAYVPPKIPVVVPAAAMNRFYAKAKSVAPPTPTTTGPTGDETAGGEAAAGGPAEGGPAEGGPAEGGPAAGDEALADAEQAAEQAFEQVLAEGGSLEDAMAVAADVVTEEGLKAVLAENPEHFGSEHSGESVLDRVVDDLFLGVTGQIDYVGAGTGSGAGHGNFTDGFFKDGVDDFIDSGLAAVEESGFFEDFLGKGEIDPEDQFFDVFFDDPFQIFNKDVFQEAFDVQFEDFLIDVFSPLEFEGGVLGFNENPFFLGPDETAFITTNVFDDIISNFTSGDESRIGGEGNTRFTMVQSPTLTLGGNDSINGGTGTDELAFEGLSNMGLIFDGAANKVFYADTTGSIFGSVAMTSIEQIFADDGSEARVRFPINLADAEFGFTGYIVAGDGTSNRINLTDGENLLTATAGEMTFSALSSTGAASGLTTVNDTANNTFGSLVFGGGGADKILAPIGDNILFGGAGNDIIDSNAPVSGGSDFTQIGGDGDDTFVFNNSATYSGIIKGGKFDGTDNSTSDTIQIGGTIDDSSTPTTGSLTVDLAQSVVIQGVEFLKILDTNSTFTAVNTFFKSLTSVTDLSGGTVTLKGQGDLDLSGVTDSGGNVDALGLDTTNPSTSAISIKDFNDTVGRTITGTTQGNRITGFGGGDSIDLGSDSAADLVAFSSTSDGADTPGAVTGMDVITNFDRTDGDKIVLTQDGFAAFDDVSQPGGGDVFKSGTAATNGANIGSSGYDAVFFSSTVATGDLTTANFANVISAIGTVTAGTATAADAENDAIFVLTDGSGKSGVYLYTNQDGAGAGNTTVEADELTLLATVDDVLQAGDITNVDTISNF